MAYYKLAFVDKRVESPEQIIASDIPKFCDSVCDLAQDILMVCCVLCVCVCVCCVCVVCCVCLCACV